MPVTTTQRRTPPYRMNERTNERTNGNFTIELVPHKTTNNEHTTSSLLLSLFSLTLSHARSMAFFVANCCRCYKEEIPKAQVFFISFVRLCVCVGERGSDRWPHSSTYFIQNCSLFLALSLSDCQFSWSWPSLTLYGQRIRKKERKREKV